MPPNLHEALPIELTPLQMMYLHRNMGKPPRWRFPDMLVGYGLRCVRLDFENFDQLWPVMAEGDTTFIDRAYRDRAELYGSLLYLRGYAPYSGKYGACDWIVVESATAPQPPDSFDSWAAGHIRLGEEDRIVGVLHLYELSHERIGFGQSNPFVGLQLRDADRGRGLGSRAIRLLEWFVAASYPEISGVTAQIGRDNERSLRLFHKLGYRENEEYGADTKDIFLTKPFVPTKPDEDRTAQTLRHRLSGLKRTQLIDLAVKYAPLEMLTEVELMGVSPDAHFTALRRLRLDLAAHGSDRPNLLRKLRVFWSYLPKEVVEAYGEVNRDGMEGLWSAEVERFLLTLSEEDRVVAAQQLGLAAGGD